MSNFSLDGYVDVAERVRLFRETHPEGSLQCLALEFMTVNGKEWVLYRAAAYRSPEDTRPGHGTAWEPIPGATPYTRNSEVQNAETAAWGRAIVAALAADTRKIASADEVRMRQEQAPAAPTTDYMAQAQSLAYQQDVDGLRVLYATAKANGATEQVLADIEALAGEIKDPAGKDEKPTGLV
jgi:hypothetical protein